MSERSPSSAHTTGPVSKKLPRTGIVGGGFAGLACGYELSAAGFSVELFEARSRLGGRVHSVPEFVPGRMVEYGAELIGANHHYWLQYAEKFKIELKPLGGDENESDVILHGELYTGEEARKLYDEIECGHDELACDADIAIWNEPWETPDAERFDKMSLAERIAVMKTTDRAKYAISTEFLMDMACVPAKMNYLALMCVIKAHGVAEYWTKTESYRCVGGSQVLASRLAAAMTNGRIHLDCPVTRITSSDDKITVRLHDGREFDFDDVILSVPPSVWSRIEFDPPLPKDLQPQMGSTTKFISAVSQPYWKSQRNPDMMTDTILGMTWEGGSACDSDEGILVSFAGGTLADQIHALPFVDQTATLRSKFEEILPGYTQHHVKSEVIDWIGDPWTQGGYSFPPPARFLQQARQMSQGFGRLHFAGEHASFGFMGFMEGGLHSGISVAARIAQRVGAFCQKSPPH